MRRLQKSIDIKAPVDQVFSFLTMPGNLLTIWPSMIEVNNVTSRGDGAHDFDWVYKMAGVRFHGHSETVKAEKNSYVEVKNTGGIPSTFQWRYESKGGATKLTLLVEYDIPTPVLGKLAEAVVEKLNEHEMDVMLNNAKIALEAQARGEVGLGQRPTA